MVLASYGSRPSYCDEPTPRLHRQITQRSLNLPASESDSSRCLSRRILSRTRLRPHYFQRRQPSPTPERVVSFWWLPEREGESAGDWTTSGERFSLRSACQDATGSLQASPCRGTTERSSFCFAPEPRSALIGAEDLLHFLSLREFIYKLVEVPDLLCCVSGFSISSTR